MRIVDEFIFEKKLKMWRSGHSYVIAIPVEIAKNLEKYIGKRVRVTIQVLE